MTYNEYINSIIKERGQWSNIFKDKNIPCERHHIIPKCMGGKPEKLNWKQHENIIWLHPKEHFIAHKLLMEENKDNPKIIAAYIMMAFPKGKTKRDYEISPEEYEKLRILWSDCCKGHMFGKDKNSHPWNYGKPMSEEQKKKISEAKKGIKLKSFSEEHKRKIGEATRQRHLEYPETFNNGLKNKICITDGINNKYINKNDVLPNNYHYGQTRAQTNAYKNMWTDERKQKWSELKSGSGNGMYNKGYKLSGGKNGHAIYNYYFEGEKYDCRDDLMKVLKPRFEGISESAIRKIMKNNYGTCIIRKYKYIIDNLTWVLKSEDKNN